MSYNNVFKILDTNTKLKSLITNMASGYIDVPYIISETLKLLEDGSVFENIISDSNKVVLCNMISMYFNDCWEIYIDDIKLDKALKYGKIEVYKVNAANGLRYATVNEVAQGISELLSEYVYPAGEETYKKLCLLQWTFTGVSYFFRQAGYTLNYDDNGKVKNTFYEMILMSANEINDLFTWLSVRDEFDKAIKIIKKMEKNRGYKYAKYEKDEISEDITIKQLVLNIYRVFPRNSNDKNYRKALALVINANKGNKLSPTEVSFLRNVYKQYALSSGNTSYKEDESNDIKDMCDTIENERYSGKIDANHFAYKIISTLKKSNYSKCSIKQYNILLDAYNLVTSDKEKDNKDVKAKTEVISETDIDTSLGILSNAIGDGIFEDEEDV